MLLNLHPQAIQKLTDLFNQILTSGEYPSSWKRAIVVAIPKPNKDPLQPTSYRPISLTSVLAKLFEMILNKRLNWYLESNGILSPNQYGFRKKRNTIQAISDLELEIREAFAAKEHLYAIFFDLEKAYDRVWRHHICQLLFKYGLRGNLPSILQSFLADRSLVVRVADQLSSPKVIQNGVPQGSVFSVTLFLIVINEISTTVPFPLSYRLFADDFNVCIRTANPTRAHRLLQLTLNHIQQWSEAYGFRFSIPKTKL